MLLIRRHRGTVKGVNQGLGRISEAIEYIACPAVLTVRLYPSTHDAGDSDTAESAAAPSGLASDAAWEQVVDTVEFMAYPTVSDLEGCDLGELLRLNKRLFGK